MNTFVKPLVAVLLGGTFGASLAAGPDPQYGTVISSTPVVVQTTVPSQQCSDEPGYVRTPTSGGGAVVGGILGGFAGNAIGAGAGRAVATGVGAIAGALVGNNVEAANTPPTPVTTTNCVYSRRPRSQVIGYDVVYDFAGQRYTTRTARDPGTRIALDVRPAGDASPYGAVPLPDLARNDPYAAPDPSSPSGPAYPAYPAQRAYPAYPAYPAPAPYTDTYYGYPPFNDYGYPATSVYIGGRFGGGWGHGGRWR